MSSFSDSPSAAPAVPAPAPAAAVPASRPRFCSECGAQLSSGARFCHRCGAATAVAASASDGVPGGAPGGRAADRGLAGVMPWAVAFVSLLALAAMAAGRNIGAPKGGTLDAPLNALPQASLGEGPGAAGPAGPGGAPAAPFAGGAAGGAGGRAPDLSSMTPRDIADRLFDRVMRLSAASGKAESDSAQFFATMALQHYAAMPGQGVPFDADLRYDMGRIAEVAGRADVAAAQADTILRTQPTHLLGLVLAIKAASLQGDAARAAEMRRRLAAAAPAERAKGLEEYERHGNDVDAALRLAAVPAPGAATPGVATPGAAPAGAAPAGARP
jgi:hypothetical protein